MWGRSATELAAGLRAREFSAREVMESHLARIAAVNPRVNAIVTLLEPEEALALADAADAVGPRGVLHGLPIAVKDLEDTAGMRTTYGSPLFACTSRRPTRSWSSACARRARSDRQDQHARVRRGVADVQRGLRGHAQPLGPRAHAGRVVAAARPPRWRRGCCRSPTAPTSARRCATRPRSATSSGCAPPPAAFPTSGRAIRGTRCRCSGRSRARSTTWRCCSARWRGRTRVTRCRSGSVFEPSRRRARARIAWSRDVGGLPVDPAVTAVLEARRAMLEELGCVVDDADRTSRARTSASRCCGA